MEITHSQMQETENLKENLPFLMKNKTSSRTSASGTPVILGKTKKTLGKQYFSSKKPKKPQEKPKFNKKTKETLRKTKKPKKPKFLGTLPLEPHLCLNPWKNQKNLRKTSLFLPKTKKTLRKTKIQQKNKKNLRKNQKTKKNKVSGGFSRGRETARREESPETLVFLVFWFFLRFFWFFC